MLPSTRRARCNARSASSVTLYIQGNVLFAKLSLSASRAIYSLSRFFSLAPSVPHPYFLSVALFFARIRARGTPIYIWVPAKTIFRVIECRCGISREEMDFQLLYLSVNALDDCILYIYTRKHLCFDSEGETKGG